jgi:hypothetical protein
MRKTLIILIFILAFCSLPKIAAAGIIMKPVFQAGLVGYWSFNEGSGTKVGDMSGNGNHGTLYDGATWTAAGKYGAAVTISNSGGIQITNSPSLLGGAPRTISFWANFAGHDVMNTIFCKGWGPSNIDYCLFASSTGVLCVYDNGDYCSSYTIPLNQWVFITAVFNTTSSTDVYVNGVYNSNIAGGLDTTTDLDLYIGDNQHAGENINGTIDEVRIYNRELSASEVSRLYTSGATKFLAAPRNGLVGYWSFNEGSGTKVGDMSGNGNHGIITGATWADGKLGKGLKYNVNTDKITFSSTPIDDDTGTIAFWYKPSHAYNTDTAVQFFGRGNGAANDFYLIKAEAGYDYHMYWGINAGYDIYLDISPSSYSKYWKVGEWMYFVCKYAISGDGHLDVYINGVLVDYNHQVNNTSNPWTSWTPPSTWYIGNHGVNNTGADGVIDEFRIYNRELEDKEITALYNSGLQKINASQNNQLTNGLVGFWSFNGPDMDGNTATDRSGQGNDGTLTGGPTRTIGKVGQALSFNGTSDYISTTSTVLNGVSQFSVAFWIKPNAFAEFWYGGAMNNGQYGTFGTAANYYGYSNTFIAEIQVSSGQTCGGPVAQNNFAAGAWYHYVAVFDGTQIDNATRLKIYLNGVQQTLVFDCTVPAISYDPGTNLSIGRGGLSYLDGLLDEVRIYNRALTAQEILRLYNLGR